MNKQTLKMGKRIIRRSARFYSEKGSPPRYSTTDLRLVSCRPCQPAPMDPYSPNAPLNPYSPLPRPPGGYRKYQLLSYAMLMCMGVQMFIITRAPEKPKRGIRNPNT